MSQFKRSLRFSKKHGANPGIELCMYCRKAKSIVLFGRLPDDEQAPQEFISNTYPCDECKQRFIDLNAIVFVEATHNGDEVPIPTGTFTITTRDFAQRLYDEGFINEDIVANAVEHDRICYIEPAAMKSLGIVSEEIDTVIDKFEDLDKIISGEIPISEDIQDIEMSEGNENN